MHIYLLAQVRLPVTAKVCVCVCGGGGGIMCVGGEGRRRLASQVGSGFTPPFCLGGKYSSMAMSLVFFVHPRVFVPLSGLAILLGNPCHSSYPGVLSTPKQFTLILVNGKGAYRSMTSPSRSMGAFHENRFLKRGFVIAGGVWHFLASGELILSQEGWAWMEQNGTFSAYGSI